MEATLAKKIKKLRKTNRVTLFAALVGYVLSLQFAYQYFMLGMWGKDFLETSWGQGAATPNNTFYVFLLLGFGTILVSRMGDRPSDYLHLLFFLAPLAPMCIISINKGLGSSYVFYAVAAFSVSYLISTIRMKWITSAIRMEWLAVHLRPGIFTETIYLRFCLAFGILIIGWAIYNGGLAFINLDFSQVYEFRRAASSSRGTLLNYVLFNYAGILIALGFAVAFSHKSFFYASSLLAVNILIFALTSNKAYLFVGVFTLGIFIVMDTRQPKAYITLGFAILAVGLTALYLVDQQQWIWGTLFVRRLMFAPAYLNFMYWEFFNENPFAYWSDSKAGLGIADYVYGRPTPQVIGDYFSGVDFSNRVEKFNNANTGWLGSGYANAGIVGMGIYAVLSGVITKFANILGQLIGNNMAVSALGFYFFAIFFTSTDLPAALLTYGFFSLLVVLALWKKPTHLGT